MRLYVFFVLCLIEILSEDISDTSNNICPVGYGSYSNGTCFQCVDPGCKYCTSSLEKTCFECFDGYKMFNGKCGTKNYCDSIKHCQYCEDNGSVCLKCSVICSTKNGKCECKERTAIIIFCIILSAIIVALTLYFLFKPAKTRKGRVIELDQFQQMRFQGRNILEDKPTNQISIDESNVEDFEKEFDNGKIVLDEQYLDKKCDICLKNQSSLKLDCGCCLCFEDQKVLEETTIMKKGKNTNENERKGTEEGYINEAKGNNKVKVIKRCLACKKEINVIQVTVCGICFQNKCELSQFKCGCAFWVCKDCYVQWKRQNQNCPAFRNLI